MSKKFDQKKEEELTKLQEKYGVTAKDLKGKCETGLLCLCSPILLIRKREIRKKGRDEEER
ncbi:hypothetical protein Hdeb2414_s0021g00577721 [Helianthus debilis subsp. tardiflorus]